MKIKTGNLSDISFRLAFSLFVSIYSGGLDKIYNTALLGIHSMFPLFYIWTYAAE